MDTFSKKINDINFAFKKVLEGAEPWYHITYTLDAKTITLRMYKDAERMWKIAAQDLPKIIQLIEMKFGDAIEENEKNN